MTNNQLTTLSPQQMMTLCDITSKPVADYKLLSKQLGVKGQQNEISFQPQKLQQSRHVPQQRPSNIHVPMKRTQFKQSSKKM